MNRIVPLARTNSDRAVGGQRADSIRTDAVYVVFTSIEATMAALRVGHTLAEAMGVPLTVIHLRMVPYPLAVDAPTGISPLETETFLARIRREGIDLRVRVYLCRNYQQTIPLAFKPHSLIVMAAQPRWWPTRLERYRRALETAGHAVVFIAPDAHKEACRA
jgi:hypothetical protein